MPYKKTIAIVVGLCLVTLCPPTESPASQEDQAARARQAACERDVDRFLGLDEPTNGDVNWIARYGPQARQALGRIIELTNEDDRSLRRAAIKATAAIGIGDPSALTALSNIATADAQDEFKRIAIPLLFELGFSKDDVDPAIEATLVDADENVRIATLQAVFDKFGGLCKYFEGDDGKVIAALQDSSTNVRLAAVRLIGMEAHRRESIPRAIIHELAQMTNDEGTYPFPLTRDVFDRRFVQHDVFWALRQIGRDALPTLPIILNRLKEGKSDSMGDGEWEKIKLAAARAIYEMTLDVSLVENLLRQSLTSESTTNRLICLIYVGEIGPGAGSLLPEVTANLQNESSDVRATACETLSLLGRKALAAEGDLKELLNVESDPSVKEAAQAALGRLDFWRNVSGVYQ